MIGLFTEFGQRSRVASLWLYSENDRYFPPETARKFHTAYASGGAPAQLILVGPSGADGHNYMLQSITDNAVTLHTTSGGLSTLSEQMASTVSRTLVSPERSAWRVKDQRTTVERISSGMIGKPGASDRHGCTWAPG